MNTNTDQRVRELEVQVERLGKCVAYLSMAQGASSQHRVRSLLKGIAIEPEFMAVIEGVMSRVPITKRGRVMGNRKAG